MAFYNCLFTQLCTWVMQGRPRRKQTKTRAAVTNTFWRLRVRMIKGVIVRAFLGYESLVKLAPEAREGVEDGAENRFKKCKL